MLDVIQDYEFSSVASSIGIQVLDFLKATFDDHDLETLKTFVRQNLSTTDQAYMKFDSGRQATKGHVAAIVKMALVLKKLTLEGGMLEINKKGSDASEDESSEEVVAEKEAFSRSLKHINDREWTLFCTGQLSVFENKWNKKLEDYTYPEKVDSDSTPEDDFVPEGADETSYEKKFSNRKNNRGGSERYVDHSDDNEETENTIGSILSNGINLKK